MSAGSGPGGGGRWPEDSVFPDLMMFLMRRKKAFLAEVQKLVP